MGNDCKKEGLMTMKRTKHRLTVSRMRKTLTECKVLGEATMDKGPNSKNASKLKGGWYENKASDFTLQRMLDSFTLITPVDAPLNRRNRELKEILLCRVLQHW
jgi:hypothetical protein